MKKFALLLAVASLVSAALTFEQGEEPSEKVFKNIVSFKGVPAKDLIPAMKFMNASMKVECSYCHDAADYAKDTPKKEITRKMIDMQRQINTDHFNGKLEVTCNSCHGGLTHPEGMPANGIALRHRRFSTEVKPVEYLKKHVDAVGGAGQILRLAGTMKQGTGPELPFEVVQSPEGRFVANSDGQKSGYDGTVAWFGGEDEIHKLWGDPAFGLIRLGRAFRLPDALAKHERLAVAGEATMNGKKYIVVRGALPSENSSEEFYFSSETGLLARVVTITRSTIGATPTYIDYSDYRTVDGVQIPHQIEYNSPEGAVTLVKYASAKPEPGFDVKGFSPPGG